MLVEDAVQVVVVRAQVALQLRAEPGVGVVDPARVVVPLPELDGAHVRRQEYGTSCCGDSKVELQVNKQDYKNSPKNGFKGVDSSALMAVCRNNIAECGTLKGCANAWNAEPQVICQGAMYVTTNWSCKKKLR